MLSRRTFLSSLSSGAFAGACAIRHSPLAFGSLSETTLEASTIHMEVVGADFDPASSDLVLIGRENPLYPTPIHTTDLMVALKAVQRSQSDAIGVSIDRGRNDNEMLVNFFPKAVETILQDSPLGFSLYESDYLLKSYGLRNDPRTGRAINSAVSNYRSQIDYAFDDMLKALYAGQWAQKPGSWHRLWFEPSIKVVRSTDGSTVVLENPVMLVKTEQVQFDSLRRAVRDPANLQSPPAAIQFARELTTRFSAFSAEQPELRRMLEMAKLVKVVRWILDQQIPFKQDRVDSFAGLRRQTPRTVPTGAATRSIDLGSKRYVTQLMGGVSLTKRNDYVTDRFVEVQGAAPSSSAPGFKTRPIRINGYPYVAASVSALLGLQ